MNLTRNSLPSATACALLICASSLLADPVFYEMPAGLKGPRGLAQGADGNFYGEAEYTEIGGVTGDGAIFKMTPDGVFTTVATFNGSNGSSPSGVLHQGVYNGKVGLWGTTLVGGPTGDGTVFSFTYDGTITTVVPYHLNLVPFSYNGNTVATLGSSILQLNPDGTLITLAHKDGVATVHIGKSRSPNDIGFCYYGVTSNSTAFKMSLDGSTIVDIGTIPTGTPSSTLQGGNNDNAWYGTLSSGGANNAGCVYRLDADTGVGTVFASFNPSTAGGQPNSLLRADDGYYYGTTQTGSANGFGGIFKVNSMNGQILSIYAFKTPNGSASLVQEGYDINDNVYGIISEGGARNAGHVFRMAVHKTAVPFLGGAGKYNGLFAETNNAGNAVVNIGTAGMLQNLIVDGKGGYRGKLLISGSSYVINGAFDSAGHTITAVGLPSSTININMTLDKTTGEILGTVSDATGLWSSSLRAERIAPSTPATYTMLIPSADPTGVTCPPGAGYATIRNNGSTVLLTGQMADGIKEVASAPLSAADEMPVYFAPKSGQELLQGWINFSSGSPVGTLTWIKLANADPIYTSGFTNRDIAIVGSPWVAPAPGTPAIPVTGGTVTVTGTPSGTLTYTVDGTAANGNCLQVTASNAPVCLRASVAPQTGRVILTVGKANHIIASGAVLQNTANVGGAFVKGAQAGAFTLTP